MNQKKLSREEVQHIAKLGRLYLTEKEIEEFKKDLSKILDYFDILKEVSLSELKEDLISESKAISFSVFGREDKEENSVLSSEIINSAPDHHDSYIKVKAIL